MKCILKVAVTDQLSVFDLFRLISAFENNSYTGGPLCSILTLFCFSAGSVNKSILSATYIEIDRE